MLEKPILHLSSFVWRPCQASGLAAPSGAAGESRVPRCDRHAVGARAAGAWASSCCCSLPPLPRALRSAPCWRLQPCSEHTGLTATFELISQSPFSGTGTKEKNVVGLFCSSNVLGVSFCLVWCVVFLFSQTQPCQDRRCRVVGLDMGPEWMMRDSLVDILKLPFPWIDFDIFIFVLPTHFREWSVHMVQVQRAIGKCARPVRSVPMDAAVAEGSRWLCYRWDVKEHQQSGVSQLLLYPNSCAFNSLHQGALIFSCFVSAYKGSNS